MKLTHANTEINNATEARTNASFRQRLLAFVDRHANTFEALAHNSAPFGTNWLPERHYGVGCKPEHRARQSVSPVTYRAGSAPKRLFGSDGKGTETPSVAGPSAGAKEIGINRFRSLRSQS